MSTLLHFIITRFNLRAKCQDRGKQIDHGWLNSRFEIFERFCFPTVRSQTEQDFRWLVLFDSETPVLSRERIATYQAWPNFIPVFFPAGSEQQARKAVLEQLGKYPDVLVTTRLDNDDGICRTFVEEIQENCVQVTFPTVLEYPNGYVWHKNRIYLDHQPRNPFSTLVEPLVNGSESEFRTVYGGSHHDIGTMGSVVRVTERPSWIQVVHGGNVVNHRRGIRCAMSQLSNGFDIDFRQLAEQENPILLNVDKAMTTLKMGIVRVAHRIRAKLRPSP